MDTLVIVYFT